jgi:AraC-like DNA-binding protein
MPRPNTESSRLEIYQEAMTVIGRRYAEADLSLSAVSREIAVSTRQVQRCLAEHGATGFRQALHAVRMGHAARLLADRPDLTVRAVAIAVGYRQPAQFAKAFRRVHGTAPAVFRQQ